jgi:DNA processing protein
MTLQLDSEHSNFEARAVSPFREMGAYEAMWCKLGTTFNSLAKQFASQPGSLPSNFVSPEEAQECAVFVGKRFEEGEIKFGVRVHGAGEYPCKLRDAASPVEVLYYQGWWDLVASRSVAVVGTRRPSPEGLLRTKRLARYLVADDFTVVSGLAAGIDTMAHQTAMEENGRTIAVIGTPLSHSYPRDNSELQRYIAEHFLVVSQVPLKRYESQTYRHNRSFFPERNVTMSALTEATIIVEAGESSGTLFQARAAIRQNRKLFILDSCFQNPKLTWPSEFEAKGAIRVKDYDDIRRNLS